MLTKANATAFLALALLSEMRTEAGPTALLAIVAQSAVSTKTDTRAGLALTLLPPVRTEAPASTLLAHVGTLTVLAQAGATALLAARTLPAVRAGHAVCQLISLALSRGVDARSTILPSSRHGVTAAQDKNSPASEALLIRQKACTLFAGAILLWPSKDPLVQNARMSPTD